LTYEHIILYRGIILCRDGTQLTQRLQCYAFEHHCALNSLRSFLGSIGSFRF